MLKLFDIRKVEDKRVARRIQDTLLQTFSKMGPKAKDTIPAIMDLIKDENADVDSRCQAIETLADVVESPDPEMLKILERLAKPVREPQPLDTTAKETLEKLRKKSKE